MASKPTEGKRAPRSGRRLSIATAWLLAAGCLASCGSSHARGTNDEPAGAVPASAPLYAEAIVRPAKRLQQDALAAARGLTHQSDPYLRLLGALRTPGSPALDYAREVAPWLGTRAGIFLSGVSAAAGAGTAAEESDLTALLALLRAGIAGGSASPATVAFPFGAHRVQGAIVLDTSDAAKALGFLDAQARRAGAHAASYRGVSYESSAEGVAFGMVDRFAVIGSEAGLRSVIDTTRGGPSLARASSFSRLHGGAPSGALGQLYADSGVAADLRSRAGAAPAGAPGAAAGIARLLGALLAGTRALNVSLVPAPSSISADLDDLPEGSAAARRGLLSSSELGAQALEELPGESWLAIGLGDAGATLPQDVQALRGLASLPSALTGSGPSQTSAGISLKGIIEGILAPLGALGEPTATAKREFQSWMGSAGLFASGNGLLELKGGAVISSDNPAASRAAVGELAAKLSSEGDAVAPVAIAGTEAAMSAHVSSLPVALDIAAARTPGGQAKFVIGLGDASVTAALHPSSTLAGAESRSAAASGLGEGIEPSVIVDVPTLIGLLEGVGLLEDPSISGFVPYLRSLGTLAAGGKSLGDGLERLRVLATLSGG